MQQFLWHVSYGVGLSTRSKHTCTWKGMLSACADEGCLPPTCMQHDKLSHDHTALQSLPWADGRFQKCPRNVPALAWPLQVQWEHEQQDTFVHIHDRDAEQGTVSAASNSGTGHALLHAALTVAPSLLRCMYSGATPACRLPWHGIAA